MDFKSVANRAANEVSHSFWYLLMYTVLQCIFFMIPPSRKERNGNIICAVKYSLRNTNCMHYFPFKASPIPHERVNKCPRDSCVGEADDLGVIAGKQKSIILPSTWNQGAHPDGNIRDVGYGLLTKSRKITSYILHFKLWKRLFLIRYAALYPLLH